MKAVIYARYSSDNQREESIDGQLRECKAFAEKNAITILQTYVDRALSAKSDDRPAFQKMIKDSGKNLFDMIIVWKLDRFARNRYDSAHYKSILKKNGVRVMSATEVIAEDSTGILLESVLEGMAEYYSAELSEKVSRGMTENALKGKYNGGAVPLGYVIDEDQHFQVDPAASKVIQEMFKMYAEGSTIKELVDSFNKRGVKTARGGKLTLNTITYILKNRRYIGEYRFQDTITKDVIPPIISEGLFHKVQAKMAKNKKAPARYKAKEDMYLLTTKMFCGTCGSLMLGESGTSQTKGRIHRYYKCASAKKKTGCTRKAIKKHDIEQIVIDYIKKVLMDDALLDHLADMLLEVQAKENTVMPMLKKQLADAEKNISNILDAIQNGIFNSSTKGRLDALEKTKEELEVSIANEEMRHITLTKEHILFWFYKFRELDTDAYEYRQRLVDSFINAVYVYDDKIVITFNYRDGAKTVNLKDVQRSDLELKGAPKICMATGHADFL